MTQQNTALINSAHSCTDWAGGKLLAAALSNTQATPLHANKLIIIL